MASPEREEERRNATIRAAWASIARVGVDGTTIDAVASIAGFSKGVIHYWFASKKDLLLASFEAFLASYDGEIASRLSSLGREPGWKDALDAIIEAILPPFAATDIEAAPLPLLGPGEALTAPYKARLFLHFFALAITDPDFGSVVAKSYLRQGEAIARCLAGLQPSLRPEKVKEQTAAFIALVDGFSLHRVVGYREAGLSDHGSLARAWLEDSIAAAEARRTGQ